MNDPGTLSRRAFLVRPIRVAAALLIAGRYAPVTAGTVGGYPDRARNLVRAFSNEAASLSALGQIYLRSLPQSPTPSSLADELFADVPGLATACRHADSNSVRTVLWGQFRREFAAGRLVYLERFAVARSEARLYAIIALLNQS